VAESEAENYELVQVLNCIIFSEVTIQDKPMKALTQSSKSSTKNKKNCKGGG